MMKTLTQEKYKEHNKNKHNISEVIMTYCIRLRQKLSEKNKDFDSVRAIREVRSESR